MYKTVPNLKVLFIEHTSLGSSQLQVISKFKQLEKLKLFYKDYETSQIDAYGYAYDEEGDLMFWEQMSQIKIKYWRLF